MDATRKLKRLRARAGGTEARTERLIARRASPAEIYAARRSAASNWRRVLELEDRILNK